MCSGKLLDKVFALMRNLERLRESIATAMAERLLITHKNLLMSLYFFGSNTVKAHPFVHDTRSALHKLSEQFSAVPIICVLDADDS